MEHRAVALRTYGMPEGITAPQGLAFVPGSETTPDAALSFGASTIDDQSWTVGTAITSLTLPTATGGVMVTITYSVSHLPCQQVQPL